MAAPSPGVSAAKGDKARKSGPGPAKSTFVRLAIALIVGAYLRVHYRGIENIPDEPYILCINHPSWLDPPVFIGTWPDRRRRLFIFGPREDDMSRGWRNRFITWTGVGVPFKPGGADVYDATRRSVAVLRGGDALLVAGEGRLSDREGSILPLEPGVAHFALLAGVVVLPASIVGTRWVHLGSAVRIRVGRPVHTVDASGRRRTVDSITAELQSQLSELLAGVPESEPPSGRFGRWFSDAFNERPWLADASADPRGVTRVRKRSAPPG